MASGRGSEPREGDPFRPGDAGDGGERDARTDATAAERFEERPERDPGERRDVPRREARDQRDARRKGQNPWLETCCRGRPGMWIWRAALLALAAAVAGVVLTCFVDSTEWVGRPFAGFLLGRNRIVAPIGLSHWSGFRAEVPFGSELVAVDGRSVASVPALVEEVWQLPVGAPRRYAFAGGSSPVELSVPVMSFSRLDYALLFGPWSVNGLLFLGLGFLVAALKPGRPASIATLVFGIAWGLTLLLSLGDFYRFHFRSLYALSQAVAPAALVFLALTFPDRPLPRRWPWLLAGFAIVTALHAAADILLYERAPLAWYRFFDWSLVYMAACALASCVLLGRFYRRASQDGRARLQVVAVGALVAFGAPAAVQLAAMMAGVSLPLNLLPGATGLFALAVR